MPTMSRLCLPAYTTIHIISWYDKHDRQQVQPRSAQHGWIRQSVGRRNVTSAGMNSYQMTEEEFQKEVGRARQDEADHDHQQPAAVSGP
jgi:hypothetical protein